MAHLQQHRAAEVVRRMMPINQTPKLDLDLTGYCDLCQQTSRIGWRIFERIAQGIQVKEILEHNLDIKTRHHRWVFNGTGIQKLLIEHAYSLYSRHETEYLVHAGVQISIPCQAHHMACRSTTIQVDMPIRRKAAHSIKIYTERTLHDVIKIAQEANPYGRSVIDQRDNLHSIETRIKVVIGDSNRGISIDPGWLRKETRYHGLEQRARSPEQEAREAPVAKEASEMKEASSDSIPIEHMEIDYEAALPQEVSNQEAPTTRHQSTLPDMDKSGTLNDRTEMIRKAHPRARSNTVPTGGAATGSESGNERILLFRQVKNSATDDERSPKAGPSHRPYPPRTTRFREDLCGNSDNKPDREAK